MLLAQIAIVERLWSVAEVEFAVFCKGHEVTNYEAFKKNFRDAYFLNKKSFVDKPFLQTFYKLTLAKFRGLSNGKFATLIYQMLGSAISKQASLLHSPYAFVSVQF